MTVKPKVQDGDITDATSAIAVVRGNVLSELKRQRNLSQAIYLPQLLLMSLVSIVIVCTAIWGMLQSVSHLQKPDLNDLKSLLGYVGTGGSGVLGAVVIPVFKIIHNMSKDFLVSENRHAQAFVQASNADTKPTIMNAIKLIAPTG